MRKSALVLVLALLIPAAASARNGDRGDGTFVVKNAVGQLTLNAKGSVIGKLDRGEITVQDLTPTANDDIQILGYDRKPVVRPDGATTYRGDKMRIRVVGAGYLVTVTGTGINLSSVGKGTVVGTAISEGLFSTDGSPFRAASAAAYAGSFGQQQ
jgi:hypothetical protein